MSYEIIQADIMEWAANYSGPKFHALCTDPPYSMKFMGKDWDHDIAFHKKTWEALAEHLLPGAFGMAFASARGYHRVMVAIEDAGLRLHPSIFGYKLLGWNYGSGFPKATRIDTQIEPRGKVARSRIDGKPCGHDGGTLNSGVDVAQTYDAPATDLARAWAGHRYGLQALKPALEPIIVFQKSYAKEMKPVDSIVETGAGALNIDEARISIKGDPCKDGFRKGNYSYRNDSKSCWHLNENGDPYRKDPHPQGRWPANFYVEHHPECVYKGTKRVKGSDRPGHEGRTSTASIFNSKPQMHSNVRHADPDGKETVADWACHPDCPVRRLGEQSGERPGGRPITNPKASSTATTYYKYPQRSLVGSGRGDKGNASRFFLNIDWQLEQSDPVFYCAKASRKEQDAGLENMARTPIDWQRESANLSDPRMDHRQRRDAPRNGHPTVKPLKFCKWLGILLLPPEEYAPRRILVPFAGSGSEMIGAALAGWEEIIGIEMEKEYCEIAEARMDYWTEQREQPKQLELIGG